MEKGGVGDEKLLRQENRIEGRGGKIFPISPETIGF